MAGLRKWVESTKQKIDDERDAETVWQTEQDVSGETLHAKLLERAVTIAEQRAARSSGPAAPDYRLKYFSTGQFPVPELSDGDTVTLVRLSGRRYVSGSDTGKPLHASLHVQVVNSSGEPQISEAEYVRFGDWARFLTEGGDLIAKGLGIIHPNEVLLEDGHPSDFKTALVGEELDEVVRLLDLIERSPVPSPA